MKDICHGRQLLFCGLACAMICHGRNVDAGEPLVNRWKSLFQLRHREKGASEKPTSSSQQLVSSDVAAPAKIRLVDNSEPESAPPPAPVAESRRETATARTEGGMGLTDLQELALTHNPTLEQAAASVEIERGNYQQAGLYPNPQIGYVNGSADRAGVRQSNGAFFSQEIVTAGKLKKAQEWEAKELNKVAWDLEAQQQRVLTDVKIRYFETLGAQRAVQTLHGLEEISHRGFETVQKLYANKSASRTDVLQSKIQLETVRASRDEAIERHLAAWQQLANVIGIPDLQMTTLDGDFAENLPMIDADVAWAQLVAHSPQIRSAESDRDHAIAETTLARAQAIPNVTFQTVAEYDRAMQASTVTSLIALPLPVFNRNQGNIYRAESDVRVASAEIERTKLVLKDLLADSLRRYQTSMKQAKRFQESILPDAEESLSLTEQGFKAGEVGFLQLLTARQTYIEGQLSYVDSLTELHKVTAEIEGFQLTGGLNPASIGTAIQSAGGNGAVRQRALLNQVQQNSSRQLLNAAQIAR